MSYIHNIFDFNNNNNIIDTSYLEDNKSKNFTVITSKKKINNIKNKNHKRKYINKTNLQKRSLRY